MKTIPSESGVDDEDRIAMREASARARGRGRALHPLPTTVVRDSGPASSMVMASMTDRWKERL